MTDLRLDLTFRNVVRRKDPPAPRRANTTTQHYRKERGFWNKAVNMCSHRKEGGERDGHIWNAIYM